MWPRSLLQATGTVLVSYNTGHISFREPLKEGWRLYETSVCEAKTECTTHCYCNNIAQQTNPYCNLIAQSAKQQNNNIVTATTTLRKWSLAPQGILAHVTLKQAGACALIHVAENHHSNSFLRTCFIQKNKTKTTNKKEAKGPRRSHE